MISAALLLRPVVAISTSTTIDQIDAFGMQFLIKNEGHVPVFDLSFGCKVSGGPLHDVTTQNGAGQGPIRVLWPGKTATRGCSIAAP